MLMLSYIGSSRVVFVLLWPFHSRNVLKEMQIKMLGWQEFLG